MAGLAYRFSGHDHLDVPGLDVSPRAFAELTVGAWVKVNKAKEPIDQEIETHAVIAVVRCCFYSWCSGGQGRSKAKPKSPPLVSNQSERFLGNLPPHTLFRESAGAE